MRGNLNLFSGERHYQTNFFSRFSSSKAEDAYSKDVQSRSRYPLLVLQIFDIMRLIYCYFIFSCGDPSQSQCNHTFLAIISLLSLFLSIVLVKKKNFSFYLMRLLLLLGTFWSNLLTLENINPISFWFVMLILSGIHNIFLINVWTISIQFQILETFFLMSYMYFFDKILFRELFDTFYLGIILILSYGLLSFGFERVQLERWVLYDSFKRSYRSLEILLSDFTFPVFIIDCNGKIIFHNQRAVNLVDEENNYLGGHFCDIFKDDTKKEIKSTIKKTWQTGVENRMLSLENHKNAEGNKINSTDNIIYEINSKQVKKKKKNH